MIYYLCREMIGCHPGNLEVALRTVVHNELGQNRSPTNMHLLAMLMHARPDAAPKVSMIWYLRIMTLCYTVGDQLFTKTLCCLGIG